jgi:hypothetical protein
MSVEAPNPFPADPGRSAIWDMLMRRDFEVVGFIGYLPNPMP